MSYEEEKNKLIEEYASITEKLLRENNNERPIRDGGNTEKIKQIDKEYIKKAYELNKKYGLIDE